MLEFLQLFWLITHLIISLVVIVWAKLPTKFPEQPTEFFVDSGYCETHFGRKRLARECENTDIDPRRAFKKARIGRADANADQPTEAIFGSEAFFGYHQSTIVIPPQPELPSDLLTWFDGSLPSKQDVLSNVYQQCEPWPEWGFEFDMSEQGYSKNNLGIVSLSPSEFELVQSELQASPSSGSRTYRASNLEDTAHHIHTHEQPGFYHKEPTLMHDLELRPTIEHPQPIRHHNVFALKQSADAGPQAILLTLDPPEFFFGRLRTLPGHIVFDEVLSKFMSRFKNEIHKVPIPQGRSQTHWFDGSIPVAEVRPTPEPKINAAILPPIIRLKSRTPQQYRHFATPSNIISLFYVFLKWLIFDLGCFLRELKQPERIEDDAAQLFNWLICEFFKPASGLPIMGEFKGPIAFYDWRAFGPVQKLIIESFYKSQGARFLSLTASNIIGIWYKNFDHQIWDQFQGDQQFWLFMDNATKAAGRLNKVASHNFVGHDKLESRWIGDFEIFVLDQLPYSVLHGLGKSSCKAKDNFHEAKKLLKSPCEEKVVKKIQKNIISKMFKLSNECEKKGTPITGAIPDVLVGLVAQRKEAQIKSQMYVLRLIDGSNKIICATKMKLKLEHFQDRLQNHLTVFIACLASEKAKFIKNSHIEIAQWLKKEMFNPKQDLPIFGRIPKGIETLKKSDFGDFQNHLITCLTKSYFPDDFRQMFSTIIGYWFKTQKKEIWNEIFRSDKDYWEFMARALSVYCVPKYITSRQTASDSQSSCDDANGLKKKEESLQEST